MNNRQEMIEYLKNNPKNVEAGKPFIIDSFKPEDAMGVIECCYSIYGDGYPVDTYYIPEKLIEANQNGKIYGVVARTNDGEVIGYGALYRSSGPYEGVYESGQYIIRNEYRGSRAAYYINAKMVSYSRELGIEATYAECVTNHLITQKFGDRAGCFSTAIEIDLMPAEAYENDERVSGRVSALFQFLVNKDKEQIIYIPEYYRAQLEETVASMPVIKREIRTSSSNKEKQDKSDLFVEQYDFAGVGRFNIQVAGKDIYKALDGFEQEIESKNYKVSQIFISLADESAIEIIDMLNSKGYFYGGLLPRWLDNDALLMQKLYNPPTFEGINLYPKGSHELLEFIKQDYKRVNRL